MNDIRSFFKSAGSGGSTKAKSGGKTNGGGDSRKSSASKKTDVKTPGGKKSGAGASSRGSSKPSPKGNAGNGTTTSTTDSKSNATNKKPSKLVKHGAADDDDDDEVEDVTPISTKEARKDTGSRKGASASSAGGDVRAKKKNNDESSTGDNRVEVVASPSKKSQASSPGARKRKAVEVATEGEVESPSRGESRGARSRRQKGEGTTTVAKKTSSPATPAGTRKGRKAHRRIEEDDEDIEGDGGDDDNGDDDDEYDNNDDDDDNFDPDEDEDEDDDDEEDEGDDDDSDDDDDDYRGGSRSRKRKSSSNAKGVSSSKLKRINRGDKKAASRTTSSSVSRDGKKQLQRVEHTKAGDAMDDDDYADGEDDETRTMRPKTSKPFASASSAARGKSSPSKKEVVDLGGTSSDEKDEEDKEAPAPAPRKKASAPSRSGATAAKESPSGENAKKTGRGGGGGGFRPWMGGARKAPPNEGKKEVPVGADQCLAGMTFVVSGVLDSLGREAAEDLIKQYGGKVTGSVSSKTTFLLLGSELDDGRAPQEGSKYRNAMKRKTKIIDENELFKMLRDSNKGAPPKASAGSTPTAKDAAGAATGKPAVTNPYAKMAVANPYKSFASKKASGSSASAAASSTRNGQGSGSPSVVTVSNEPGRMWVDKYKPQTTADVIGHGAQVKKLRTWLQNWEAWHLKSNGPTPPKGSDNPGARAALLSGAPGVGKSSTATLVAKELGYHVMELNASDTRNKRSLSEELDTVVGNQVLGFTAARSGGSASKPKKGGESGGFRKQLVIMDEVDGMGGSDRGGIQELISLIKKTKVPIIAICNDRQHQKIRSLVNHCYDLRFSRPQKATIAKRVRAVAKMEGLEVDDNAAEMLVEANGNDIRQVLHALEMWSRKSSKLSYMNLKEGLSTIEKDKILRCGPFEAARSILGGGKTPLRDRYEAFFTDYSLLPLLVQQNYLSSLMTVDAKTRVEVTAGAAAAMSDMDIVGGKIRGDVQHWELLPTQAALTVRVGSIGSGSLGYPEFPKWLGMFSRENKRRRLLGELATHLNAAVSGGPEAVRLSYLYYLKTFLTLPLRERGVDGAQECVDMLEEYGLSRDDLFEVIPEFLLSWKGMKNPPADVFAGLDSKCKSAVTRCYNSIAHKSQALVDTMQAPKAKKTKAPPKSLAMEEGDDSEEDVEEEDGEDDVSAFKTKGKPRGSTGGKNSTPKSRGKAASSGGGRGRK